MVEHFEETLNQPDPEATYDFDNEIHLPKLNVNVDMTTEEETASAISKMKNKKAAALDETTAELMKPGGQAIISTLTTLLSTCWTSKTVPDEWRKNIIVKLPKKGILTDCNNWKISVYYQSRVGFYLQYWLKDLDQQLLLHRKKGKQASELEDLAQNKYLL